MRYSILLGILGLLLVAAGLQAGTWGFLLYWLALDFIILGFAHARGKHRIFGKAADGTLPWWSWLLYLPLLAYTSFIWHLVRTFSRERVVDRVNDGIFVGRRLLPGELKEACTRYIDLTSEFQEPGEFRKPPGYFCFPILDASAPSPDQLAKAVEEVGSGPVFIHCAQGHGRTGLFTLALLISRGEVRSVEEGLALLTKIRPGIGLNAQQMSCIRDFAEMRPETRDLPQRVAEA